MNPPASAPSITEITYNLYLGDSASSYSLVSLEKHSITSMVSVIDSYHGMWDQASNRRLVPQDRHLFLPSLDTSTQDLLVHLAAVCDFIDAQLALPPIHKSPARRANPSPEGGLPTPLGHLNSSEEKLYPRVLVHCAMGLSRSATVVIAYLMRKRRAAPDDVLREIRQKRKVNPNDNFMEQLRVWDKVGYEIWLDAEKKIPKEPYRVYLDGRAARLKVSGQTGHEPIVTTNQDSW